MELAKKLKIKGYLTDEKLEKAFKIIDRVDFVLEKYQNDAYLDVPLPIGEGQTISQPAVVAFMLELLQVQEGNKIMDIGCGSGWTTALLAFLAGDNGRVISIERKSNLLKMAKENIAKYVNLRPRIRLLCQSGSMGYLDEAPYDRILVSAALKNLNEIPQEWINQLQEKGIIVFPAGNAIYKGIKKQNSLQTEEYFGFNFVDYVQRTK